MMKEKNSWLPEWISYIGNNNWEQPAVVHIHSLQTLSWALIA